MRPTPLPAVLTDAQASFIVGPHSIYAASRSVAQRPSMARCLGCELSADRQSITLLFHAEQASALLRDIRETATIAVVYNEPTTHVTLQLKGNDARKIPLPETADAIAARHLAGFFKVVEQRGFSLELVRAALYDGTGPLAAVRFTPVAAFQQTPGPKAGERLA